MLKAVVEINSGILFLWKIAGFSAEKLHDNK